MNCKTCGAELQPETNRCIGCESRGTIIIRDTDGTVRLKMRQLGTVLIPPQEKDGWYEIDAQPLIDSHISTVLDEINQSMLGNGLENPPHATPEEIDKALGRVYLKIAEIRSRYQPKEPV